VEPALDKLRGKSSKPGGGGRGGGKHHRVLFVTDFYEEQVLAGIADYVREKGWELHANMRFHGLFRRMRMRTGFWRLQPRARTSG
jgi:hypothetical protein